MVRFGLQCSPTSYDGIVKLVRRLDGTMIDFVTFPDELSYPNGMPLEPWSIVSSISTMTTKLRVGVMVSDVFRHHPAILAHTVATADVISRGRVVLGLGAGGRENLDPFGIPFGGVLNRVEEYITVIRKLWKPSSPNGANFSGKHFQLKNAQVHRPYLGRVLPIWLAANSPRMIELAAKLADGWIPVGMDPSKYESSLEVIKNTQARIRRGGKHFEPGIFLFFDIFDREKKSLSKSQVRFLSKMFKESVREVGIEKTIENVCVSGEPDYCKRRIGQYVDSGVINFILRPLVTEFEMIPSVDNLLRQVVPSFKHDEFAEQQQD